MNNGLEISQHTSQQYNHELEDVRSLALQMGGVVEEQLANALKSLLENDTDLAEQVALSDYKVNRLEVTIDEQCAQIIARRQPAASDLRLLIAVIKSVTDLERIGDEVEKIARYSAKGDTQGNFKLHVSLLHLGEYVKVMLRDSLDAMARMDSKKALEISHKDERIDQEFEQLTRSLLTRMMEDPRNIKDSLNVTWCARSLERIGDHCKNICEYVVYFVEGRDIRHTILDEESARANAAD